MSKTIKEVKQIKVSNTPSEGVVELKQATVRKQQLKNDILVGKQSQHQ